MKFDLWAHSTIGMYALFDPLCVPTLLKGRSGPFSNLTEFLAAVAEAPDRGDILTYHADWDGELRVRIYVGERPDAYLAQLATESLRDSLLRVPSGRLILLGAELMAGKDPQHLTPDRYQPAARHAGMEIWLPAVDYRVTAYEVDTARRDVPEEVAQELKSHTETINLFNRHVAKGCLVTACVLPLAVLAVMVSFLLEVTINLGAILALAICLIAAWWSVVRHWRLPEVQLAIKRRRELLPQEEARWPELLLVLHPLDGPAPAQFNPGRLGPGVARHYTAGDRTLGAG